MQIAALANLDPSAVHACYATSDAADKGHRITRSGNTGREPFSKMFDGDTTGQCPLRRSKEMLMKHDKRGRTGSGRSVGSARIGKWDNIFSEKNSESD